MTERERRERLLRQHGSFGERERREREIQRHEIKSLVDRLKQQVREFEGHNDERSIALRLAWLGEIKDKLQLLLKLQRGEPIPPGRIRSNVNEVAVLKRFATTREVQSITTPLDPSSFLLKRGIETR